MLHNAKNGGFEWDERWARVRSRRGARVRIVLRRMSRSRSRARARADDGLRERISLLVRNIQMTSTSTELQVFWRATSRGSGHGGATRVAQALFSKYGEVRDVYILMGFTPSGRSICAHCRRACARRCRTS